MIELNKKDIKLISGGRDAFAVWKTIAIVASCISTYCIAISGYLNDEQSEQQWPASGIKDGQLALKIIGAISSAVGTAAAFFMKSEQAIAAKENGALELPKV